MTNLNRISIPVILILYILSSISCKKDNLRTLSLQEKVEDAKQCFLEQTKSTTNYLSNREGDSLLIRNEPNWNEVKTEILDDQSVAIILPVKTNLYELSARQGELNLVINYNADGKKYRMLNRFKNTITDTIKLSPLDLYYLAFPKTIDKETNKSAKIHNITIDPLNTVKNIRLKANKLQITTPLKDNLLMNSGCTHYFWVEKTYSNGVIINEEWSYMYSVGCGGGGSKDEEQFPTPEDGSPQPDIDPTLDSLSKLIKTHCLGGAQLNSLTELFGRFMSGDGNTEWACLHKKQYDLMISKGAKFDFCMKDNMQTQQSYNTVCNTFNFQNDFSLTLTNTFEHEFFHAYQDKFLASGTDQYAIGTNGNYPSGYINIEFETALYGDIIRDRASQDALNNSNVPDDIKQEYRAWLDEITASNTKYPKTIADFGGHYFYFMEKFRQYSGYANMGNIDYNLKPNSLLNLFSISNCK